MSGNKDCRETDHDGLASGIQVFLRVRPSKQPSGFFCRDDIDENRLVFQVPKAENLIVNNTRTTYGFEFNGILEEEVSQEQVFNTVGIPAVQNALDGFNSTVFAYGQTGSGKTFTITGGPERYADRGIIPRAISYLFTAFQSSRDVKYSCCVSYLELYNEKAYDLLAEEHSETSKLEDMQRVTMLEDEDGNFHFRNLSIHPVGSEEDALNYLFLGDTNRAIGETEMNLTSSRSHCVFTLAIEGRKAGSDCVTRSKLNLVDLAGSERVHRTSSSGQTLKEAKYINSSLLFLEMVIVALHEKETKGKERTHIPYRNSMMTSVLRDSLGGNCKTIMIATISPEAAQTEESISTCNFAQRVALVKNSASVNEELEPELIIRRLRTEVGNLREEIKFLKGESGEGDSLNQEQHDQLAVAVREYVDDRDVNAVLRMGSITLTKLHEAHAIFKKLVWEATSKSTGTGCNSEAKSDEGGSSSSGGDLEQQIFTLQKTLLQRDTEIAALVKMVNQGKGSITNAAATPGRGPIPSAESKTSFLPDRATSRKAEKPIRSVLICGVERCSDETVLEDLQVTFDWFKERYPGMKTLEENKEMLKTKCAEAKAIGEVVQKSKGRITHHKSSIEQLRRERALDRITSNDNNRINGEACGDDIDADELKHRKFIEEEKVVLKEGVGKLAELKPAIQHLQRLMEKGRGKLNADFELWYQDMCGERPTDVGSYIRTTRTTTSPKSSGRDVRGAPPRELTRQSQPEGQGRQEAKTTKERYLPPGVQLTGSKEADEDIIAFYKAKEALLARSRRGRGIEK